MYVHENMVRIFWGYKSLYTPRVYTPLLATAIRQDLDVAYRRSVTVWVGRGQELVKNG